MGKSLDGVLTKKAYKQESFTEAQLQDLAICADETLGYLHFSKNFFIPSYIKSATFRYF